jgi:Protein of unknown function (DUF3592)
VLGELYDKVTLLFSWRWPTVEGDITSVDLDAVSAGRRGDRVRLAVAYKFCVGRDGPYTGEYYWDPRSSANVLAAKNTLRVGQSVTVRYRPDDPSVSTLADDFWPGL